MDYGRSFGHIVKPYGWPAVVELLVENTPEVGIISADALRQKWTAYHQLTVFEFMALKHTFPDMSVDRSLHEHMAWQMERRTQGFGNWSKRRLESLNKRRVAFFKKKTPACLLSKLNGSDPGKCENQRKGQQGQKGNAHQYAVD